MQDILDYRLSEPIQRLPLSTALLLIAAVVLHSALISRPRRSGSGRP